MFKKQDPNQYPDPYFSKMPDPDPASSQKPKGDPKHRLN